MHEGIELFNSVTIVARGDLKEALEFAEELLVYIENKGVSFFLEETLAKRAKGAQTVLPLEKMKADLIITLDGDGTILRTCLQLPQPEPPILAINLGIRGFLAEVTPREGINAVEKCLQGKFTLDTRACLKSRLLFSRGEPA